MSFFIVFLCNILSQLLQLRFLSLQWSALPPSISFPLSISCLHDTSEDLRRRNIDFRNSHDRHFLRLKFLVYYEHFLSISGTFYAISLHLHRLDRLETREENCFFASAVPRPQAFNDAWERKLTKTMAIVVDVYLICWIPSVVFYSVLRPGDILFRKTQPWINSVYYLSAVLNPFIYGVRSKKFRREVRRLMNKLSPVARFIPNDM